MRVDKRKIVIACISDAGARRSDAQGASGDVEISIARRNRLAFLGFEARR
jgi:hypothetical protein